MATGGEPDYALDERSKDGYVRVRVEIPNIKAKSKGMLSKVIGGRKDVAKNAQIQCDLQERSFSLTVTGDNVKGMDGKSWTLQSTKLPHPIDPCSSHWVTEDGFVNIYLKKASSTDEWSTYIRKGQLEA
ncbi:uncharacterized protein [Littorina saxatilis]|uniref:CS domain-containing protein n=1 Tax=Littorina saxatilis TaxID=31220 RepID=A0AAN9B7J9_9CAEN